ncbi:MAG: (d)CMP kinase [Clostridiales bacterium]|jgi:cytidylate kinase|nr:(d)CMP kinase [Clostridiales bacterium]
MDKTQTPRFAVAIDGPGGAGKSTVAKRIAQMFHLAHIDTGAMYRAIALYYVRRGLNIKDEAAVEKCLADIEIEISPSEGGQQLFLNGEDVTQALRTQEIAEGSSVVAVYAQVREKLTALQRAIAENGRVVMDGRDIGSQVLPWAQVKIYLDASIEARVKRRVSELQLSNKPCDPADVRREIEERDYRDTHRKISPLTRADGAVYLDTSEMDEEEVIGKVAEIIIKGGLRECSTVLRKP